MKLQLAREWHIGNRIDGGGFGSVFEVICSDTSVGRCVVKMVPKDPGAQRELLFAELGNARNVVPILDSGEILDYWVLVMPRAEKSLRKHIEELGQPLDVQATIVILSDIAAALADLDGKVIHRDLKPENVLFLSGKWCLADFGISRYVEATTAADTRKHACSPPYSAPERWRSERGTSATDIYSLGIIAFELLAGERPFRGKNVEELREQHLHQDARPVPNSPSLLVSLISACLYKSAAARPSAQNVLARLQASLEYNKPSSGLAMLQAADLEHVTGKSEEARKQSLGQSETMRRQDLLRDAQSSFHSIGDRLSSVIVANAPSAKLMPARQRGWSIHLSSAVLTWTPAQQATVQPGRRGHAIELDVIAFASISVRIPPNRNGYEGVGHSLWFCDADERGKYAWFETAFMFNPLTDRSTKIYPFAAQPHEEAVVQALGRGLGTHQLAWPFTQVSNGDINGFVGLWSGWLAQGAQGTLNVPATMPSGPADWRR